MFATEEEFSFARQAEGGRKSEIRNPKSETSSKSEIRKSRQSARAYDVGFGASFGLRASDFGIERAYPTQRRRQQSERVDRSFPIEPPRGGLRRQRFRQEHADPRMSAARPGKRPEARENHRFDTSTLQGFNVTIRHRRRRHQSRLRSGPVSDRTHAALDAGDLRGVLR